MKKSKGKQKIKAKPVVPCPADKIKQGYYFKNEEGWCFECMDRTDKKLQGNRAFDDHAHIYSIGSRKYKQLVRITKKEYNDFDKGILDAYMSI